jgi:serine/threonine protein phosphatase 1
MHLDKNITPSSPAHLLCLPENEIGRDFIVGDLHGAFDALMAAMESVDFDKSTDRIISVGDLIDRGAKSLDCFNLVYEPWFFAVRGNHEQMMHDGLKHLIKFGARSDNIDMMNWLKNGGDWFLKSDLDADDIHLMLSQVSSLPLAIQIGDTIGVVHAEPPEDWQELHRTDEIANEIQNHILWSRIRINNTVTDECKGIDYVFVGHTPVHHQAQLGNVVYVDFCAYKNNKVTLVELEPFLPKDTQNESSESSIFPTL